MYKSYKLTATNDKDTVIAVVKAENIHIATEKFRSANYVVLNSTKRIKLPVPIKRKKKEITHETIKKRNIFFISNGEFKKFKDISVLYKKGIYHLV